MENNSSFPLNINSNEIYEKKEKKLILNIEKPQDIYLMVNTLKPYMNEKNQYIMNLFEKWKDFIQDLRGISSFQAHSMNNNWSINQSKDPTNLLSDLKPFIHEDYYLRLYQIFNDINKINESIINLQKAFKALNNMNDDEQKINILIDAFQPFMNEEQRKTVNQLKSMSETIDIVNALMESTETNINSSRNEQESKKSSNVMNILDLLKSPPADNNKIDEKSSNLLKIYSSEQKEINKQKVKEVQYEKIPEEYRKKLEMLRNLRK